MEGAAHQAGADVGDQCEEAGQDTVEVDGAVVAAHGSDVLVVEGAQHFGDGVRGEHGVRVDEHEEGSGGFAVAAVERRTLTGVVLVDVADLRVRVLQLSADLGGGVAGAVVDDEHLEAVVAGGQDRPDTRDEDGFFVVGGHDHGDARPRVERAAVACPPAPPGLHLVDQGQGDETDPQDKDGGGEDEQGQQEVAHDGQHYLAPTCRG